MIPATIQSAGRPRVPDGPETGIYVATEGDPAPLDCTHEKETLLPGRDEDADAEHATAPGAGAAGVAGLEELRSSQPRMSAPEPAARRKNTPVGRGRRLNIVRPLGAVVALGVVLGLSDFSRARSEPPMTRPDPAAGTTKPAPVADREPPPVKESPPPKPGRSLAPTVVANAPGQEAAPKPAPQPEKPTAAARPLKAAGTIPMAITAAQLSKGLFGFPQAQARKLHDTDDLRVSCWNDKTHLYVQAILWKDNDGALGETADGRPIGDWSDLLLDVDADGRATPQRDRNYSLNPWPTMSGLYYQIVVGEGATTGLQRDSHGRGAIRYVEQGAGKRFRVDSFVIPLEEIGKRPGERIRLAYWGNSPHPEMTVNSVGYRHRGMYYGYNLPRPQFHSLTLADRPPALDLAQVPEGREDDTPFTRVEHKALPAVGMSPPEISAREWLNTDRAPRLAELRGQVVLVEFWATWCGPCVENIPHLNALYDAYASKGLRIVSLTDQSRRGIEAFLRQKPIKGIVGAGSESGSDYGISAIPHTFLIGRDGKLLWHGHPADEGLEKRIVAALGGP